MFKDYAKICIFGIANVKTTKRRKTRWEWLNKEYPDLNTITNNGFRNTEKHPQNYIRLE